MTTAFQTSAFQSNAFQIDGVGGSDYSTIPLHDRYSRIPLSRRKRKDELEELLEQLNDIAAEMPRPAVKAGPEPVIPAIYNRALFSAFMDERPAETVKTVLSRARANAEFERILKRQLEEDDDDESAILLLMQ